jgi:hypothetical protein
MTYDMCVYHIMCHTEASLTHPSIILHTANAREVYLMPTTTVPLPGHTFLVLLFSPLLLALLSS